MPTSKFYVYNRVPLVLPASSRFRKDKVIPRNSPLVVTGFDGKSCNVKPAGKGNYRTIEVSNNLLALRLTFTIYGPVVGITLADFLHYGKYEPPYDKWFANNTKE